MLYTHEQASRPFAAWMAATERTWTYSQRAGGLFMGMFQVTTAHL